MSTLLRLSIVYAGFLIPMRLSGHRSRMIQTYVGYAIGYYALFRFGFAGVEL